MANGRKQPSVNTPLGLRVGKGPSRAEAVKITNNLNGWAEVASIPVPPAADTRDFNKPLGKAPILLNGGVLRENSNIPSVDPVETTVSQGFLDKINSSVEIKENKMRTVQIMWYGALLTLDCLNAVYQPANSLKGLDGWLMLELPILEKTKAPAWTPPVAQLDQNGKMHIPEFDCTVDGQELKCQVLNIDIHDKVNNTRVFIFRVSDFTE
jgi:hypothetical protein